MQQEATDGRLISIGARTVGCLKSSRAPRVSEEDASRVYDVLARGVDPLPPSGLSRAAEPTLHHCLKASLFVNDQLTERPG